MKISEQFAAAGLIPGYLETKPFPPEHVLLPIEEQSGSYELDCFHNQGYEPLFWSYHARPRLEGTRDGESENETAGWKRIDPFSPFHEYL